LPRQKGRSMPLQASLTALAALCAVVVLILLVGRVAPRLGLPRRVGASRRLFVRETMALDSRRRLHLVACDGREVLLMTGGPGDLVVGWLGGEGR
ncbi:MAG: hypothetical protein ACRYHQ_30665, partial [Janthinobacterium lividum]